MRHEQKAGNNNKNDIFEMIVLGEIEGKNRAIHAYDGMMWKIRVAGDNADMSYESKGYREAAKVELSVYLMPLLILVGVIFLVVR